MTYSEFSTGRRGGKLNAAQHLFRRVTDNDQFHRHGGRLIFCLRLPLESDNPQITFFVVPDRGKLFGFRRWLL
jgi:hypothetical protein